MKQIQYVWLKLKLYTYNIINKTSEDKVTHIYIISIRNFKKFYYLHKPVKSTVQGPGFSVSFN